MLCQIPCGFINYIFVLKITFYKWRKNPDTRFSAELVKKRKYK